MKTVSVIAWKMNHANGLGYYGDLEAVANSGQNVANLIQLGGLYVKWPTALGPPPDEATLAQWAAEFDTAMDLDAKERAALAAIKKKQEQDALTAALNDPNAPPEVKAFKAAKK